MVFAVGDFHPNLAVCYSCCHCNQVLFVVILCPMVFVLTFIRCSAKSLHLTQEERLTSQWVSKLIPKFVPTELGDDPVDIWLIHQLKVVECFSRHMAITNGMTIMYPLLSIHTILVKFLSSQVFQFPFDPIEAILDYITSSIR